MATHNKQLLSLTLAMMKSKLTITERACLIGIAASGPVKSASLAPICGIAVPTVYAAIVTLHNRQLVSFKRDGLKAYFITEAGQAIIDSWVVGVEEPALEKPIRKPKRSKRVSPEAPKAGEWVDIKNLRRVEL